MIKTCYLHIGVPKTGTTSIQRFLSNNRERLLDNGYYYPEVIGIPDHRFFAFYFMEATGFDENPQLEYAIQRYGSLTEFHESLPSQFRAEIDKIKHDAHTLIISCEHLISLNPTELEKLRNFLEQYVEELKIVCYIRRQDSHRISSLSTQLKNGQIPDPLIPSIALPSQNYRILLDKYAVVFGRDNMIVRVFESRYFVNEDLIEDFCHQVDIHPNAIYEKPERLNEALSPIAFKFLMEFNKTVPEYVNQKPNPAHRLVPSFISQYPVDSPLEVVSRQDAYEYCMKFKEDNQWVAREYFGRDLLFSEDFSDYPEAVDDIEYTFEDAVKIGAFLLRQKRGKQSIQSVEKVVNPIEPHPNGEHDSSIHEYQKRDYEVVDYQTFKLPKFDYSLRGPEPESLKAGKYITCVGAAQTFGVFTPSPFPHLLQQQLSYPVLNLSAGGAMVSYFDNEDCLSVINQSKLVILQVMSGRSITNSRFISDGQTLTNKITQQTGGSFKMYSEFLTMADQKEAIDLLQEIQTIWVDAYVAFLKKIHVPVILLYFSTRQPDYQIGYNSFQKYAGKFPHFVNQDMLNQLKSHVNDTVMCASDAGLPQPLYNRFTGQQTTVKVANGTIWKENNYYPSPEMHVLAFQALLPFILQYLKHDGQWTSDNIPLTTLLQAMKTKLMKRLNL